MIDEKRIAELVAGRFPTEAELLQLVDVYEAARAWKKVRDEYLKHQSHATFSDLQDAINVLAAHFPEAPHAV